MSSQAIIPLLVTMMLVTGVCNTLLTKYQDLQCIRNCDDPERIETFEQPVIQTAQMFIGEMGCWLVVAIFAIIRRYSSSSSDTKAQYAPLLTSSSEPSSEDATQPNPIRASFAASDDGRQPLRGPILLLLALPAICDITGTTLMNVGLLYVAASIYQMTRGALVLFVGLFSVLFLRRRLRGYQWSALVIVVLGVAVVGLAGAIAKNPQAKPVIGGGDADGSPGGVIGTASPFLALMKRSAVQVSQDLAVREISDEALQTVLGVLMIAGAQIFTATQFVLEEWVLENYSIEPLKMVGWEGTFGFLVTFIGMIILHWTVGVTEHGKNGYFDAVEGWRQITHDRNIAVSSILIMISIGGFNFFGISVTRSISATSRSTIDTCRTLFIWIVSLALGWETFKGLQILGFALLVYGTFLFNDIVAAPTAKFLRFRRKQAEPLLPEEPIEHM